MYKAVFDILIEWNKSQSDRAKLQYAYAVLVVALVLVAGIIGLLNDTISVFLLQVVFALALVWAINAVAWALLKSFLLERIPKTIRKNSR